MNHVAIDLGGRESQICTRGPDGTIVDERKVFTKQLPELVNTWPQSRVVMETSAEAFRVADAARAAGHQVRVVPTILVRALGVAERGIKTDQRDARNLSRVSCQTDVPSVHIPSEMARELKSMCGSRERLLDARTALLNNVRGWMRTQLIRIRSGGASSFVDRVRGHCQAQKIELPEHIDRLLLVMATMAEQLTAADKQLRKLAKQHPICQLLMTVPGVGCVTAVRFVAALDEPTRFTSTRAVHSYLGLAPGENSSSDRKQRTGITKAGPTALRRTLVQAAWAAIRSAPSEPMVKWAKRIAERRGKFIAVVALARKIAGILHAMWRDGTTYRSSRSAGAPLPSVRSISPQPAPGN